MRINYLFIVFAIVLLASCGDKQQKQGGMNQEKSYHVLTVQPQDIEIYNDFPASIQGKNVVEIRPKVDGYIEKIFVDEGASVKRGQALFRINNPQYLQNLLSAQAAVNTAQAELASAQMNVRKVRPLVEKEIISSFELESAEYTLRTKQAAVAEAKATVANAQTNVGYTSIASPMDGIIGTLPHKEGSYISSATNEPLTTISSSGNMYAYFSMNEKYLLEISKLPGATMQEKLKRFPSVTLLLADGSVYPEKGRVETASGMVTTETGAVSFRATFPNPLSILKNGNSGVLRLPRTIASALVIPQSATYDLQGKHFAYVLSADNTVKNTALEVTATPDGKNYIVTDGLQSGDEVVIEGVSQLKAGDKIIPVKK